MAPGKVVVGNERAEMMDMMEPYITWKILQNAGEFVKWTSFQRHFFVIPGIISWPVGGIELMLDVEKPETKDAGDTYYRQLDQEECF